MVTIEVLTNIRCRVTGLDKKSLRLLDEALAIDNPNSRFIEGVKNGLWDGRKHLLRIDTETTTGTFPCGLVHRVEGLLQELGLAYDIVDHRTLRGTEVKVSRISPNMLAGVTLRPYQVEAISSAAQAHAGIIWLATGAGKTEVGSALIKVFGEQRCLFLVHKKGLLAQARSRIALRLGIIEEHIGVIGAGKFDPKHITVGTIQTLSRKMPRAKQALVRSYLASIRLLIVDEGHHAKSTTWYRLINKIPAPQRYILSGTPYGGDSNGLLVEATVGPVVAHISNATMIEQGYSALPTITFHEINEPTMHGGGSWQEVYKEGIVLNTTRNNVIAQEAARFAREGKPCLILVKELWHGDVIATMLRSLGVNYSFVHGKMPINMVEREKQKFEAGKISVLLASPIFDEGVDVPAIRSLVIADGGKSVRSLLQKIGRGLRRKQDGDNTLAVVDFSDQTHRWLAAHSLERLAIYEAEGFKVVSSPVT